MKIVNNRFWRLEPARGTDPTSILESPVLIPPADFISKLKRLDGIVVGAWDPDSEQGKIHGLGVVLEVDGHAVVVDWRRANFTLRPTGPGATQWRKRPFFRFADLVADRYKLLDHFHDAFAAPDRHARTPKPQAEEAQAPALAVIAEQPEPRGHVAHVLKPSGPQRNRVAPDGEIFATPERGMFMGNRTSPPRWLICDLHFQRDLKEPRKYTKLFFLDEAVALAAGHRPCNTCRRDHFRAYLASVSADINISGATDLDAKLGLARKHTRGRSSITSLPDGAFVALDDGDYRLKWGGALHRWTPGGYVEPIAPQQLQIDEATVLTPEPSLAALRNGYQVAVHPTAG